MKVLYKWSDCFRFENYTDAYYLEIHKSEITDNLLSILDTEEIKLDDKYYEDVKNFSNSHITHGLSREDCIYALIDKNVTSAFLCWVYYPYSGQWGSDCPFKYVYETDMEIDDYLKNAIEISDIDKIKNIDNIITSKGLIVKN